MHEARREPLGREPGDGADDALVEGRRPGRARCGRVGPVVGDRMVDEPAERRGVAERGEALEAADADVAVAEADQHRRARRRGLVAAAERLAGLDEREGLRGVDPERLEHLGREDLAHAALQRQPPVAAARPGRRARALGAEVEQPAVDEVARLGEEKAAAVAEVGVVGPELVAVVAQRQRLGEAAGQRLEAAEVARSSRRRPGRRARCAPPSGRCGSGGASRGSRPAATGSKKRVAEAGVDRLGAEARAVMPEA